MATAPTIEIHVVDWLPSIAWIVIEQPDPQEHILLVAGSDTGAREALEAWNAGMRGEVL